MSDVCVDILEGLSDLDIPSTDDGRRVTVGDRQNSIKNIQQRHREIGRLASIGLKHGVIAERLNISTQNVSDVLNSPLMIAHVADLQAARDGDSSKIAAELKALAVDAVEWYHMAMSGELDLADKDTVKIAGDILDRTGQGKISRMTGEIAHAHLTLEDINEIKQIHKSTAVAAGALIEVKAEPPREDAADGPSKHSGGT